MSRRRTEAQEKPDGVDSTLAKLPGRVYWDRKKRKKVWQSTLPIILRDLAPSSGFDPQRVWKKAQEEEEEDLRQELSHATIEAEASKKKGGGKKAGSGAAMKEKIIETAEKERKKDAQKRDNERIANKKSCGGRQAANNLVEIRGAIETPEAKLELLLEILSLAVNCKDKALTFDVLWAIEKNTLYQEGKASNAERKALEKALKKEKEEIEKLEKKAAKEAKKDKKEGKDKKDKKKKGEKDEKMTPKTVVPPKTKAGELLSSFKSPLKTVRTCFCSILNLTSV